MCRSAKIRPMLNGTDRPIAAVWRIWSQNEQTRKRHARLSSNAVSVNQSHELDEYRKGFHACMHPF